MRTLLAAIAATPALLLPTTTASAHADDPLICVETGATTIGPHTIDPPDPCIL